MKDPRAWWIDSAGIGACVLLTACAFAAGLRPALQAQAQQLRTRDQVRSTQAEADRMTDLALNAERRHTHVLREQEEAEFELFGPGYRLQRLKSLSDLATETGLVVLQVDPGEPSTLGQHLAYPLRLRGHGPFTGVTTFLSELHAEFRDVRVLHCRINRALQESADENKAQEPVTTSEFEFGLVWFAVRDGSIVTVPDSTP